MKKIRLLLLAITATLLLLQSCKKVIDSLVPKVPNEPTITAVGTPIGTATTKTIGKTGGTITSADGKAELIFPAGALDNDAIISIQAVAQTAPNGIGLGYQFLPEGMKFLQPVSLKFHYTANDLTATSGDMMGVSFQDSTGGWWRLKDFANDTASKMISASIKHFTVYAPFACLFITPVNGSLEVGKSRDLTVQTVLADDDELSPLGPVNEELAPLRKVSTQTIVWLANGVVNGNSTSGTVSPTAASAALFKAPAKVPSLNPVRVEAQVGVDFTFHGKKFDKGFLFSYITIVDGLKFLMEIRETETAAPFVYKDTASLMVLVSADGKVTVSDITNFPPNTQPGVGSLGDCTATWINDGVGEVNITGVTGAISGSAGDPERDLILQFTHSGTVSPKFKQVCSDGVETTDGGIPINGFPTVLSFKITPNGGIYFTDDGQEFARLTLQ